MRVSSVVAQWTRAQMVMRSNPGWIEIIYCVMQPHGVLLHCTNNLCNKSCTVYFSKVFRPPYVISGLCIKWRCKWRCCLSRLTSSFVRQLGITDYRKLKSTGLGQPPAAQCPAILELNHAEATGIAQVTHSKLLNGGGSQAYIMLSALMARN
jgi:hypothetical protein